MSCMCGPSMSQASGQVCPVNRQGDFVSCPQDRRVQKRTRLRQSLIYRWSKTNDGQTVCHRSVYTQDHYKSEVSSTRWHLHAQRGKARSRSSIQWSRDHSLANYVRVIPTTEVCSVNRYSVREARLTSHPYDITFYITSFCVNSTSGVSVVNSRRPKVGISWRIEGR